jgi:hypothetical protein
MEYVLEGNNHRDQGVANCSICSSIGTWSEILLNGIDKICETSCCEISMSELEQCYQEILAHNEHLRLILEQSRKRRPGDKRVPPGSNAVRRSVLDIRFLIHLVVRKMAQIRGDSSRQEDIELALNLYREALMWCPKSVEACLQLGRLLRTQATSADDLSEVEYLLSKAVSAVVAPAAPCASPIGSLCDKANQLDALIFNRELRSVVEAKEQLILFCCQENNLTKALGLLREGRYTYKLSQEILHYKNNYLCRNSKCGCESAARSDSARGRIMQCDYAMGVDSVLSPHLLRAMQYVFRPDSPFWAEHHYDFFSNASRTVGYFSYLYPIKDQNGPSNLIEQVIDKIYSLIIKKFPRVENETNVGKYIYCLFFPGKINKQCFS